ncbi:MAG: GGDEF domain-containing phosphodiesterase [Oscillospiraceae bacterium]|nr:GGDEF domain-containing phosphodiesterase [Oscillospiraceae bacterium]
MGKSIFQALDDFLSRTHNMGVFVVDFSDNSYEVMSEGDFSVIIDGNENPLEQLAESTRIHEADRVVLGAFCRDLLNSNKIQIQEDHFSIPFRGILSNDTSNAEADYKWITLTIVIDRDENLMAKCIIGHLRMMNNAEILNKIIIDSFTNDKHPQVFNNQAKRIIEDESRNAAIVQFDIENFKLINVRYGEEKGTEILNYIKNGLDTICTDRQVYTRLSADVFMIAMSYDKPEEIERLISRIEDRLGSFGDISYKLVFGVNIITDRSLPMRKHGDRTAMARQSIKGNALKNVCYYTDNQENSLVTKKFIEDRMDYALEHGEFVMYLQPKYSISTAGIVGAEALVRWIHPEKGMLPPMDFIPVFEKNGFIIKLDQYIWEQACKAIRGWIDSGVQPVPISVNISRVHLADEHFIDVLDSLIEKYGIPQNMIETEITETVENAGDGEVIKKLKERGYMLLMDDFGSGYSSLNMLKNTPFDVIKIDRDFFSEFMLSDRGKKIISHTISMSKDIGLDMVAEGVETKEQAEFLQNCGCDVAQGYYYSKPVCVDDFERLVYDDWIATD